MRKEYSKTAFFGSSVQKRHVLNVVNAFFYVINKADTHTIKCSHFTPCSSSSKHVTEIFMRLGLFKSHKKAVDFFASVLQKL